MVSGSAKPVSPRARRLAERIHVLVAQLLETRVKDPRLGFVTITEVRMTGDLQHASVFYTVMGPNSEGAMGQGGVGHDDQAQENARKDSAIALRSATGLLRSEVGQQLGLRLTPTLEFIPDALPDSARHVEDLLQRAAASDAQVRQAATGAQPAGDADPYRKPHEGALTDDEDDGERADHGEPGPERAAEGRQFSSAQFPSAQVSSELHSTEGKV